MPALQTACTTKQAALKQTAHPVPVSSEKVSDNYLGKSSKRVKKVILMTEGKDLKKWLYSFFK